MSALFVKVGKLRLKNPVMVASGTFGYASEFEKFFDLNRLGALVTKTVTLMPRQGNPMPRTCETPAGMLNSIGLENPGLEAFLDEKLPYLKKLSVPLIMSISSEGDIGEFVRMARRVNPVREISALELNISCPNVGTGGRELIAQDTRATHEVVRLVRKVWDRTLITKLSPNVTSIVPLAVAAQKAGSDALALINTLTGMSVDIHSCRPKIARGIAGLSGPAIRPIAVRMVWEASRAVKIPIIGMGGIMDTESALEFIIAGATAVSVGTANFVNPRAPVEIIDGIRKYLKKRKIDSVSQLTGALQCPCLPRN